MKKIVTLLLALYAFHSYAQKAAIAVGVKDEAGKPIVQLKFMFPDKIFPDAPVNVYRKLSPSGTWQKISPVPVTRATLDKTGGDESYNNYRAFMNRKRSADASEENNAMAIAGLMVITDNAFAKYAGCYFEDPAAETGKSYQYRITSTAGEKEVAVSEPITVNVNYLPVIKGATAKQVQQSVNLNWEKNSRFYAYQVYKKNASGARQPLSPNPILLGKLSSTASKDISDQQKYTDTSVTPGNTITYEVTGIDVLGNESAPSAPVTLEIKDMVAPEAITKLKFKIDKKDVLLTWQPVTGNDVKVYNVYRNTSADTTYKKITQSPLAPGTASYADKGLNEGAVYGYKIESVDQAGNGTLSRAVKAFFPDKTPPAKPTGLRAVTKPGVISLTWEKNKEADLKGYYIFRASTRDKEDFNKLYKETISGNTFTDTLPGVAKNEFVYYVQAVDKHFNVSAPSDTVIARLPDTMAPHAPVITSATFASGDITLDWNQPDADGLLFDIYRSEDSINSNTFKKVNTTAIRGFRYIEKPEKKGQAYYYYAVAMDETGNRSTQSTKRVVYVDADPILKQPVADITANPNTRDSSVTLLWKSSKNIRGNIVYRKSVDEPGYISVSSLLKQDEFTDRTAEPGKQYQYKIRSFFTEDAGFVDSKEVSVRLQ